MGQLRRILRFSGRALVDRKYRNHVLDVVSRHVGGAAAAAAVSDPSKELSAPWIAGRRMYLVGGCELTYIKDFFAGLGVDAQHTFDHGGSSEPLGEVSNPASPLWTFDPHYLVFSQVQLFSGLVFKQQSDGLRYTWEEQEEHLRELGDNLRLSIRRVRERFAAPIFLMSYLLEYRPAFGIHEYRSLKSGYSLIELLRRYELMLYGIAREEPGVYVLDVNVAVEEDGKRQAIDRLTSDGVSDHFSRDGGTRVAARLLYQCASLEPSLSRVKCAVFDLDGTLWSGVLREDGPGGVAVRRSYRRILTHLARRGILLAICSKNDPGEEKHLPDLLGKGLFGSVVAKRINWSPKSVNLRELARELNIGLDSIAFFDDNPFERAEVEANAPGVRVFTDADIPSCLERPEFEPLGEITAEGASRKEKYVEQTERETAAASAESIEAFLMSCRLELTLKRPSEAEIPRMHELLQRTNQLNATLRRTSLEDLRRYYGEPDRFDVCAALLADKFGDYGLIGLGIAERDASTWSLLELAFSCRAMGKKVEHALLLELFRRAEKQAASALAIDFQPTDRNGQLRTILDGLGFQPSTETNGSGVVRLVRDLRAGETPPPPWLKILT
jgi:FkbH-like protein